MAITTNKKLNNASSSGTVSSKATRMIDTALKKAGISIDKNSLTKLKQIQEEGAEKMTNSLQEPSLAFALKADRLATDMGLTLSEAMESGALANQLKISEVGKAVKPKKSADLLSELITILKSVKRDESGRVSYDTPAFERKALASNVNRIVNELFLAVSRKEIKLDDKLAKEAVSLLETTFGHQAQFSRSDIGSALFRSARSKLLALLLTDDQRDSELESLYMSIQLPADRMSRDSAIIYNNTSIGKRVVLPKYEQNKKLRAGFYNPGRFTTYRPGLRLSVHHTNLFDHLLACDIQFELDGPITIYLDMNSEIRSMYSTEANVTLQVHHTYDSFLRTPTSAYFPEVVERAFDLPAYATELFGEILNADRAVGAQLAYKLFTLLSFVDKNPRAIAGGFVMGIRRELVAVINECRYSTKDKNSWLGDMIKELGLGKTAAIGKFFTEYVNESGYQQHRYHRNREPVYYAIHNNWTDRANGIRSQLDLIDIIRFACAFKAANGSSNIKEIPYQEYNKSELTVLFSVNSYIAGGDDIDIEIRKDDRGEIVGYTPHVNVSVRSDSSEGMDLIDNFFRYTLDKAGSANIFIIGDGHYSKDFPEVHI